MYFLNDAKIHQDYVRRFICGKEECKQSDGNGGVYKLKGDPRITPVGHFLRRTSLDELPQFFNVLRGEMSLVGPRPPVPYETEAYDIWHRRRFLEAMPGITGLWQVNGRSKCTFDEMVRLDIKYANNWSLGLDLQILLETPRAVFFADGAY
jgi:lipopolysaccharide/colanic/teichoic acid biosynthesis glycosyltransferase